MFAATPLAMAINRSLPRLRRTDPAAPPTTAAGAPHPHRVRWHHVAREAPLVLTATALVSVVPALLAARVLPPHGAMTIVGSAALAVALSAVITRLCATGWSRRRGASDAVFAELMLWTWLRRHWAERRLGSLQQRLAAVHGPEAALPIAALARMGRLLEMRETTTYGHSRRVARHARSIARAMHLPAREVERIRLAAVVHDIGKLYTPREILNKPGRLTDAEFAVIKRHPGEGADMLSQVDDPELVAMVRHHHERLDGNGYPAGLAGPAIPLGARIIAVADTFDALTSTRSYRPPATHKRALGILAAEAGTQLDADVVAAFLRHYSGRRPAAVVAALGSGGQRLADWVGGASAGVGAGAAAAAVGLPAAAAATALLMLGPALHPLVERGAPTRASALAGPTTLGGPTTPTLPRASTTLAATTQARTTTMTRTPSGVAVLAPTPSWAPSPSGAPGDPSDPATAPAAGPGPPSTPTGADQPAGSSPDPTSPPTIVVGAPVTGAAPAGTPQTPVRVPAVTAPGATAPTVTSPTGTTPTVTTPAATTPTVTTPAVTTPTVTTPAVTTPTVTTPAATTPAVTTPAVTTPAVTTPAVTTPAVTTPTVTVPTVTTPAVTLP